MGRVYFLPELNRFSRHILMASFLVLIILSHSLALEVPARPQGRITDLTNTLSQTETSLIEKKLADYEEATTNQIAVLLIPTLEGDSLEDYSIRLGEKWKIGQKDKDNGVIILIVKNDRKIRIEVGYGLEPVLPDGLIGSIRDGMTPYFKQGDFFGGIDYGIDAIIENASPDYAPSQKPARRPARQRDSLPLGLIVPLIVVFLIVSRFMRAATRHGSRDMWGFGGPFIGHGSGGYWGGGGGFGGGGFSGGGGGFGGGGASGSW